MNVHVYNKREHAYLYSIYERTCTQQERKHICIVHTYSWYVVCTHLLSCYGDGSPDLLHLPVQFISSLKVPVEFVFHSSHSLTPAYDVTNLGMDIHTHAWMNICTYIFLNKHIGQSATIHFQRIWRINNFGRLTGYSLVLVHYIGTGKLWWIERFGR